MSDKKAGLRELRMTVGAAGGDKTPDGVKVDDNFQKVMKDLAGIPSMPEGKKRGHRQGSRDEGGDFASPFSALATRRPGSPSMHLASTAGAKKAARQLRGFRTTFGQKKGEDGEEIMTDTEKALLGAKKEAEEEEEHRKEGEERKRKEEEAKDLAERKEVKEALEKWKVKKTDSVLNLEGKNFNEDDIEVR